MLAVSAQSSLDERNFQSRLVEFRIIHKQGRSVFDDRLSFLRTTCIKGNGVNTRQIWGAELGTEISEATVYEPPVS